MTRKTASDRREQEYRNEQRFRDRIVNVTTWEQARSILQDQPTSGYAGASLIGEFGYFFGHLQRAVERLPPYHLQEPEYASCIPGGASAEQLEIFQAIVPRLVTDNGKCKRAIEALRRAIDERRDRK